MKKNIGFVSLDLSLAGWLQEKLRLSGPDTPAARELLEGLADLAQGRADSLMLELGEGQPPGPDAEAIRCGGLSIDLRLRRVVRDGMEIALTPKEFDILYFLAATAARYLPRNRSIRLYGKATICWMTATSWRLYES